MMESTMKKLVNILDTWNTQKTEASLTATVEILDRENTLVLVRKALKQATQEVLMLIMNNKKIKIALEAAIV